MIYGIIILVGITSMCFLMVGERYCFKIFKNEFVANGLFLAMTMLTLIVLGNVINILIGS